MVGRQFGVWRIVEDLALGGMGQVFVAERSDGQFAKKVALKTIKSGSYSATTKEKFITEMQTLAQLEHPNIARLIDGGVSEDGILYIAMELVEGVSVIEYARTNNLNLNQRLGLLIQLCHAIAYAHQNLIVHGDIKPDNVLVNQQGQVKLLDFGVSGHLQPWTQNQPKYLPHFSRLYAAPEQLKGKNLTTSSDVFGLTAVLYELCCGFAPRESGGKEQQDQFQASIVSLSQRMNYWQLHQANFKQALSGLNQQSLTKLIKGELGALINKGLFDEVKDRYKTADELKTEIYSLINHDPVLAYSSGKVYLLKKSFNKYKATIVVGVVGFLGMLAFALLSLSQYQQTKAEAEKANWNSDFLLGIFEAADPVKNQQNPISVNELTEMASKKVLADDSELSLEVQLNALSLLGNIQYKLGQAESASKIHLKQIDLLQQQNGELESLAQAHYDVAMDYQQMGLYEPALKHFKLATEVIPIDEKVTHMGVTALQSEAMIYLSFNKLNEAEMIINKLLSIKDEILKTDKPFESMSNIYVALAGIAEARKNYELGLDAIEKTKYFFKKLPYDPIFYAQLLATESSLYSHLQQHEVAVKSSQEALEIFKRHYGLNHPESLIMLANHASLLGQMGDYTASIETYLELMVVIENVPVPDYYFPIMSQNLAHQYRNADQCDKGIKYFKQAEGLWNTLETRRPLGEVNNLSGLARCYLTLNDLALAEKYFDQALLLIKEIYGSDHSLYTETQLMKTSLLLEQDEIALLNEQMPQLYQKLVDHHGSQSTWVAKASLQWAKLYERQADQINSQVMAQKALNIYQTSEPASQDQRFIAEARRLAGLSQ
jgi:serine/threonine-protein kinase